MPQHSRGKEVVHGRGLFGSFPASQPWGEGAAAAGIMSPCLPWLTNPSSCTQNSAAGEPRLKHWCEITSQGYLRKGLTREVGKKSSSWQPSQGARGLNQWYRKALSVHVKE